MVVKPTSRIHQKMQTWVILIKIIIVNDAGTRLHVNLTQKKSNFHHGSDISFKLSLADPERESAIASRPGQWSSGSNMMMIFMVMMMMSVVLLMIFSDYLKVGRLDARKWPRVYLASNFFPTFKFFLMNSHPSPGML